MPHSSSIAAQQRAQRDAASQPGVVEHAFEALAVRAADEAVTKQAADRLGADIALAGAEIQARPRRASRPRIWGLDARLFVADLRRMQREVHPG